MTRRKSHEFLASLCNSITAFSSRSRPSRVSVNAARAQENHCGGTSEVTPTASLHVSHPQRAALDPEFECTPFLRPRQTILDLMSRLFNHSTAHLSLRIPQHTCSRTTDEALETQQKCLHTGSRTRRVGPSSPLTDRDTMLTQQSTHRDRRSLLQRW